MGSPAGSRQPKPYTNCLRDQYEFQERGEIDVKGKGRMMTYLLVGPQGTRQPCRDRNGYVRAIPIRRTWQHSYSSHAVVDPPDHRMAHGSKVPQPEALGDQIRRLEIDDAPGHALRRAPSQQLVQ